MKSRRITNYFPPRKPASVYRRCYFLEVPPHIRQTIYRYAGLIPNECLELNHGWYWHTGLSSTFYPGDQEEEWFRWFERLKYHDNYEQRELPNYLVLEERASLTGRRDLQAPYHLLLLCRTVHQEVTKILYGSNYFGISREPPEGLGMLEKLSPLALRSLRALVIRLNDCSPDGPADDDDDCRCTNWAFSRSHPRHPVSAPLGNVSRIDRGVLKQWKRICSLLAAHVPAHQFNLYVICDCKDIETAKEVARSMKVLPTLADCAIRFAIDRRMELSDLAEKTVWQLLRPMGPMTSSSRLMQLPNEILLQILGSTQLGGPSRYFWWSAEKQSYKPFRQTICDISLCNEMFPPYTECWLSLPDLVPRRNICPPIDWWIKVLWASSYCGWHQRERGDELKWRRVRMQFCRNKSSAFATHCPCDQSALSPFLVSRRFRELAIETFYGTNTFLLTPYPQEWKYGIDYREGAREGEPLSYFLRAIPQYAIRFLRQIIVVFPSLKSGMFQNQDEHWLKWTTALSTLVRFASLDKLCLEIYFTDIHPSYYYLQDPTHDVFNEADREWLVADYQVEMFLTYLRAAKELRLLATHKLRCLGVHVCWPPLDGRKHDRQELERALEEAAMGTDYDAAARGKTTTERFWWEDWRWLVGKPFIDREFYGL